MVWGSYLPITSCIPARLLQLLPAIAESVVLIRKMVKVLNSFRTSGTALQPSLYMNVGVVCCLPHLSNALPVGNQGRRRKLHREAVGKQ